MKTTHAPALIIAALLAAATAAAMAQTADPPPILNYQGRVSVDGVNFDGAGQFRFALVNAAGTTTYWSNDGNSPPAGSVPVAVTKGLYSLHLGDASLTNMAPLPATVFSGNSEVYLRVWFDDGVHGVQQLAPDQRIVSVAYALQAGGVADGAITSGALAAGAVTGPALADGAVDSTKIADGAIAAADLGAGAVGSAAILDGSVGAGDLGIDSVSSAKIVDGTIVAADLASGAVDSAKIADGAIAAADLGAGAVGSAAILDATISAADLDSSTLGIWPRSGDDISYGDGKVGIGTSVAPAAELEVVGTVKADAFDGPLNGSSLTAGSVAAAALAPGSVTGSALAANAVDSARILNGSIAGVDLGIGAVGSAAILDGSVGTGELASNSVNSVKIVDGTIAAADLATGAVDSTKIADGAIAAADLGAGAVGSAAILDGSVGPGDLGIDSVSSAKIVDGTIVAADLASGAVDSAKIADGAIAAADLGAGAVGSAAILDATISAADLDSSTLGIWPRSGDDISYGDGKVGIGTSVAPAAELEVVGTVKADAFDGPLNGSSLTAGSVAAAALAPGSVTGSALAANAVDSARILNGSIAGVDLGIGAVGSAAILDGSVGTGELASNSVNSAKIVDGTIAAADLATGAVDSAKIADGAIAAADLGAGAVGSAAILDGSVGPGDLGIDSVSSAKIVDGTIVAADLASGAVTSSSILDGTIAAADLDASTLGIWNRSGGDIAYTSGNVGVGAASPQAKLHVNGAILLSGAMNTPVAGMLRWTGSDFEGYDGAQWQSLTPSSTSTVTPLGDMVWIRPGSFSLGSPVGEPDRSSDEDDLLGRQTTVTITKGFWMGIHEVTQQEYLNLIGSNPSVFAGNLNRPVETVSWNDAVAYCAALTTQERTAGNIPSNWEYRLPREAEWEYACRAGTVTTFSYGNDNHPDYDSLTEYGWYEVNSGDTTHPVGEKLPNPWGLYDMHGNVCEWCQDRYGSAYPGGAVIDPEGPTTGSTRVSRGGSWFLSPPFARSASRIGLSTTDISDDKGFRVVLAPTS